MMISLRKRRAAVFAACAGAATLIATSSFAQEARNRFAGPHIGASVGAVQHHFVAEEITNDDTTRRFNVYAWGIAGEVFAGYDWQLTRSIMIGIEGQLEFGGTEAVERNASYAFGFDPRYGFSASGRVGYVVSPDVLLYAGAGYGQHNYRTIAAGNVAEDLFDSLDNTRSVILRAGAEVAITRRANVRLEFEHLDGTRNQFMLGVPIKF